MTEHLSESWNLQRALIQMTSSGRQVTAGETLLWDAFRKQEGADGAESPVPADTPVGMRKEFFIDLSTTQVNFEIVTFNESAGMTAQENVWRKENGAVLTSHINFTTPEEKPAKVPDVWGSFLIWSDSEVTCFVEFDSLKDGQTQHGDDVFELLLELGFGPDEIDKAKDGEGVDGDRHTLDATEMQKLSQTLYSLLVKAAQNLLFLGANGFDLLG